MVFLFSAGIAWSLQANVMGLKTAAQAHTELLAIKGVQEYWLELLRSTPYDTLAPQTEFPFTTPSLPELPGGEAHYWVEPAGLNLKQVTVRVKWKDPAGHDRTSVVSTLIGKSGLTDQ